MPVDIGAVIDRTGLPASTLRYYEQRGLIASTGRLGGRRQFDETVVERLALITLGQAAGFSLDEIAEMFDAEGRPHIDRDVLRAKAAEIDRTIRRLTSMRDSLQHAAACPAPSHFECETFLELMDAAASGAFGRPGRDGSPQ
ncbi:MAG: helix-turn-helix domain-containing protein [Actinomycetota bacterium]